ncbi:M23 family metallopeptidase [Paremcibacter congregatus]|uniref:M23 family metallopeptidase n=1 Tax=Paremcibacter congregatus TaxID=2043170 RepID=UPI0030EE86D6|tara:strand:+ start:2008 stop:2823 length:816 start_codon:yes stop_codon:yes gene_type:complete
MRFFRMMFRAMMLAFVLTGVAQAKNALGLPDSLTQGGFYVGKVAPGGQVWLGDRKLKVSGEGDFAFGLNWKQGAMLKMTYAAPGGQKIPQRFTVTPQTYDVTHIDGLPQKMVTPPAEVLARIRADGARVGKARTTDSARKDFTQGFIWPVRGRISGNFGNHRILNGTPKSPHTGMDIAAPEGTDIVAPLGGKVTMVSDLYYTGNTLIIDHGFGVSTVFAHLQQVAVKEGQDIRQGEKIGTVGATGRATGPHLHWGLNWYKERLNPALVLGE